jgi:hypothetical protein
VLRQPRGEAMNLAHTDAVGNLPPDLAGPVKLELALAEEQLPGQHALSGGSRYELKWDGYLH